MGVLFLRQLRPIGVRPECCAGLSFGAFAENVRCLQVSTLTDLSCRPIDGAADALRALQDKFRFIVVTSRQLAIESQTRDWISMHFGGIFEDVLLANHYAKSGEQK